MRRFLIHAAGTTVTGANFNVTPPLPPKITSFFPIDATVGSVVTIDGSNFFGVSGVSFSGVPAVTFSATTTSTIMAVVPAGASAGQIAVTAPGGVATTLDANTAPNSFVVLPLAAPTVDSFSLSTGPVGTLVRIQGNNLVGIISVKFNGKDAQFRFSSNSSSSFSDQAVLEAVVPVGATTGPLTVTTPAGTGAGPIPFTVLLRRRRS